MTKKKKPMKKMKPHSVDCVSCRVNNVQQHNVPKYVEDFRRVKPVEAFGKSAKVSKKVSKNVAKKATKT